LTLKLNLALASSFNLSTLGSKLCFFLLSLGLCGLPSAPLLFLLDLPSLNLLLKGLQAGFGSLALLGNLAFLALCIIPIKSVCFNY
jgi:hypothetical protein